MNVTANFGQICLKLIGENFCIQKYNCNVMRPIKNVQLVTSSWCDVFIRFPLILCNNKSLKGTLSKTSPSKKKEKISKSIPNVALVLGHWHWERREVEEKDNLKLPHSFHCVKSVIIPSFFWSIYSASLRIQSECGKIRTRKTPYFDVFHALFITIIL